MAYEPRWKIEGYGSYGGYLTAKKEERTYDLGMRQSKQAENRAEKAQEKETAKLLRLADKEQRDRDKDFEKEEKATETFFTKSLRDEDKKADKEEYEAGKEHAQGIAYQQKVLRGRQAKVQKVSGEVVRTGEKVITQATGPLISILRGMGRGGLPIPRGIVHPDQTIRNRELYFGGNSLPDNMQPLGRPMTDWRELYFGNKPVQQDAAKVLNALANGAEDIESIKVYTGIDSNSRINSALSFLQRQGQDTQYLED